MRIITFSGPSRCGKDFCAEKVYQILLSKGLRVKKGGFSDAIKEYTAVILGISVDEVNEYKNNQKPYTLHGQTVRQILQRVGTDIFRDMVQKDYWAQTLKKKIVSLSNEIDVFICTDARYQNEMDAIQSIGCKIDSIYVEGNVPNDTFRTHESEHGLDGFKFNHILDNTVHSNTLNNINKLLEEIGF